MSRDDDIGFAPIDQPDVLAPEDTWAVLLQTYKELPYSQLAHRLANIANMASLDIAARLHHQQGIVWENLPEDKAKSLASILTGDGFPSIAIPQDQIVKLGRPAVTRRAVATATGIEVSDMYGVTVVLPHDRIVLAQAGWVSEAVEIGPDLSIASADVRLTEEYGMGPAYFKATKPETGELGWVLHLFSSAKPEWIRIEGRHFSYEYQDSIGEAWQNRFRVLLGDFAKVLPEQCLDECYKSILNDPAKLPAGVAYRSIHDMVERAVWILTLKATS